MTTTHASAPPSTGVMSRLTTTEGGHRRATVPTAIVTALIAGGLMVLAFPPFGYWPLAVLSVTLFGAAVHRRRLRGGLGIGFLAGLAFFLPLLSWSSTQVGQWPWIFLSSFQALFFGLLGMALAALSPLIDRYRWLWPLLTAAAWVGQEALRDRYPWGGFPWGRLAFSQSDSPTVQAAWLGGAPMVTFLVALAGGILLLALWRLTLSWKSVAIYTAGAAAIMLAPFTLPLNLTEPDGDEVTIAVVQGNVPRIGLDFNAQRRAVLDNHVQGTIDLAEEVTEGNQPRPDVVVWPENASDIDPLRNDDAYEEIQRAAETIGAPIVVGGLVGVDDELHNASLVWDPDTGPGFMYSKQHPVPFAEYVPAQDFFTTIAGWIDQRMADGLDSVGNFTPGEEPGVIPVGDITLSGIICFEVAYDGLVAESVREGADFIAVQTNNATFNNAEATQQMAMVQLRSVEHGRDGLMASTVGVSGFTDHYGTVSQATEFNTAAVIVDTLHTGDHTTPATRVGILPEMAAALVAVVALGAVSRMRLRRRKAERAVPA